MRTLCGVAIAIAIGASGCGDDDDDAASGTQPKRIPAETAEQATEICRATIPKAVKVLGAKSIPDFERYGRQAGAVVQELRDQLEPLDPGPGAAQWGSWLKAIDADLAAYRKLELAGSVANREVVLENFAVVQKATPAHVARELRLPACAEATNRAAKTFD